MAYHWGVAVHYADNLDVYPLLIHVLQQPHHLTHTHPFTVCVAHSDDVVALFQTVSLRRKSQGGTQVRGETCEMSSYCSTLSKY